MPFYGSQRRLVPPSVQQPPESLEEKRFLLGFVR